MAGELMGLLFGNMMNDRARAQQIQDQLLENKFSQQAFENQNKVDQMKRQFPTIGEQTSDLDKLNPKSLTDLLLYHGKTTPEETAANIAGENAKIPYLKSEEFKNYASGQADLDKSKGNPKKLNEVMTYAGTLHDQIGKLQKDLNTIPDGFIEGKAAKLYGSTGKAPWSGAQQAILSRLDPIVDTYVKMTAGRANLPIIKSMKQNIIDSIGSTKAVRDAAICTLLDYLDSEYKSTAAANGANIDDLPSFAELSAGKLNSSPVRSAPKPTSNAAPKPQSMKPSSSGSDLGGMSDDDIKKQLGL